jgi:molybdopterin/thiamine biosynthesis adenylyltransferase
VKRPDIVIAAHDWRVLYKHLIRVCPENPEPPEEMAFLLASLNESQFGLRLLVRELLLAKPGDLAQQGSGGIKPTPEFVAQMLNCCEREGWSLIEAHSHPFDTSPTTTFSGTDWRNDRRKMPVLSTMFRDHPFQHATMVVGQTSLDAHLYEPETETIVPIEQVTVVGAYQGRGLTWLATTSSTQQHQADFLPQARHQRQMLFFGQDTQRLLGQITIAIVGVSGLGAHVVLQAAHLGLGHLILIDPERVEESNLNRLLGVGSSSVGQLKVEVYRQLIERIAPNTRVTALPVSVYSETGVYYAKGADLLIGCVDNYGARLVLNQLAARYLLPFIDAGTGIKLPSATRANLSVGGQVQVVLPGTGCLECRGMIDTNRAKFDLATEAEQAYERAHGYGTEEVAPSVIPLNGVTASLLVHEVLCLLSGQAMVKEQSPGAILYNALSRGVAPARFPPVPQCPTCGKDGVLAVGDLAPLRPHAGAATAIPSAV